MATTAEVFARSLREAGVRRIFGLPGGEVVTLIEACRREGVEFVLTRHEATAGFMADVTGQISRRPGVCLSTLGPGATDLVSGVANAYLDRSPVLAITGDMSTEVARSCTHQQLNLNALYAPITKWSARVVGEGTAPLVRRALALATEGRPGPVHLVLPSDVARSEERQGPGPALPPPAPEPAAIPRETVRKFVQVVGRAARPVLFLGIGVDPVRHRQAVLRLLEATGMPALVTPKAKGVIPEDHPLFAGVCSGMAADDVLVEFLEGCDLYVGVGFDPVECDKIWFTHKGTVSLDTTRVPGNPFGADVELIGDPEAAVEALLAAGLSRTPWTPADVAKVREAVTAALYPPHEATAEGLSPYHLALRLRAWLPRETMLSTDVGSHKLLFGQIWPTYEPLTFFMSNGLSSMGYGFPAALAAKLLHPERPVVAVCGDGGFMMSLHDLETAVRLRLGVVTLVLSDRSLALIRLVQEKRGYPPCGVDFEETDFAAAARAMGAAGVRAPTFEEVEVAVRAGLAARGPTVVDIPIDPSEYAHQM